MPANGPVDLKKAVDFAVLKDRNVLITGGASGLGKHMVHMFADNGANVVIGDVQDDLGAAVEKELSGKAKYVLALALAFVHAETLGTESSLFMSMSRRSSHRSPSCVLLWNSFPATRSMSMSHVLVF
jgi:hypothetical protein